MFDSLDHASIIEYINSELLVKINVLDGGVYQIILRGYKNPDEFIINTTNKLLKITSLMIGMNDKWFNDNITPILNYLNPIITRIFGNDDTKILTHVCSIILVLQQISYLEFLLPVFKLEDNEKIIEIKEKLNLTIYYLKVLSYIIIGIKMIDPKFIGSIEKRIMLEFNKLNNFFRYYMKVLKEKIINLFIPQIKQVLFKKFNIDDTAANKSSQTELVVKNKYYYVSILTGGNIKQNNSAMDDAMEIIKKYIGGTNLIILISNLYNKYFSDTNESENKPKFRFNEETGLIEVSIPTNRTIWMTSNKTIKIVCTGLNIKYISSDGNIIDQVSYFNGKPIHLAIVLSWLESKKSKQSNKLVENNFSATKYIDTDPNLNKEILDKTCVELYGLKYSKSDCDQYYYSILGNSSIGVLQILNKTNLDFSKLLNSSNKNIHYEILKTLKFKKNSNGQICSYDQWFNSLNNSIKQDYSKYLTSQVINTINRLVQNFNS